MYEMRVFFSANMWPVTALFSVDIDIESIIVSAVQFSLLATNRDPAVAV